MNTRELSGLCLQTLIWCFPVVGLTLQFRSEASCWFSPLWMISTTAAATAAVCSLCQTAGSIQRCCLAQYSFDLYLCEPCVFQLAFIGKTVLQDRSSTSERNSCNSILKQGTGDKKFWEQINRKCHEYVFYSMSLVCTFCIAHPCWTCKVRFLPVASLWKDEHGKRKYN